MRHASIFLLTIIVIFIFSPHVSAQKTELNYVGGFLVAELGAIGGGIGGVLLGTQIALGPNCHKNWGVPDFRCTIFRLSWGMGRALGASIALQLFTNSYKGNRLMSYALPGIWAILWAYSGLENSIVNFNHVLLSFQPGLPAILAVIGLASDFTRQDHSQGGLLGNSSVEVTFFEVRF